MSTPTVDLGARYALRATGLLRTFNQLGVLQPADVHVAARLGAVAGEADDRVLLALALAVRAVRHGSVVLRLAEVPVTVVPEDVEDTGEVGGADLPWPEPGEWLEAVRRSRVTTDHDAAGALGVRDLGDGSGRPLHLADGGVWLDRYWRQERAVAEDLSARAGVVPAVDPARVAAVLARLWPGSDPDDQRHAAAVCLLSGVAVLGGGPGTGKTTTVARLVAALRALGEPGPPPRIALAAPTGKAAARLTEAVGTAVRDAPAGVFDPADAAFLGSLQASTLHRLLGMRPGSVRARYDAGHRLPHDVVIVDEASMVGLGVVARLLAALRPSARLVLVGDPDQLASVEVGAVLADLAAPAASRERAPHLLRRLAIAVPHDVPAPGAVPDAEERTTVADGVVLLRTTHRFAAGGGIADLAQAVRAGDAERTLAVLRGGDPAVRFHEVAEDEAVTGAALEAVRADVLAASRAVIEAAAAGDAVAALAALDSHRVLCAHRRGFRGVSHWAALAHRWSVEEVGVVPRPDGRYVGLPVLVTSNDPVLGVFNGDSGVVLERAGELVVALGRGDGPRSVPLSRLAEVETLHAMSVHRSQGSQFAAVSVLAAPAVSPLATREMLYTAITRARRHVRVIGSADAVAAAVERPLARATGLAARLR
ncbi:exodeoxyribonuclease V subunit alpha [Kineococcus rubinsiae]|uniref:exodeoxyribonuclease V subunit alpha n=1 Tax=Kineococcus rubinsiae TaxID=2609562 RepID=UPI00143007F2|nr:exodeoxyribonuclease V subunit alpha [Kineococcus rubinsiae]